MLAQLRQRFVTPRIFAWARKNLPALSQTEREALGAGDDAVSRLERAFELVHEVAPLKRRMHDAGYDEDRIVAASAGLITDAESARLAAADEAVLAAIVVDSFTPEELIAFAPVKRRAAAQ